MKYILLLSTALFLLSCGNNDKAQVISIDAKDQQMNTAIEKAKATLNLFFENYKTMENVGYSLKFGLTTSNGSMEHIWFNPIEVDGDTITAECANAPRNIPGLKMGDVRDLKRDQITDWMIVSGNRCYGGYTLRVLAQRYPDNAPAFQYMDF